MTKNICFPALCAALGVVFGTIGWLTAYSAVYTPDIEFNGPAGGVLFMTMIWTGFVFGLTGYILYLRKNPNRRPFLGLALCSVTGAVVFFVLAYGVGTDLIERTDCYDAGIGYTCSFSE